MHISVMEFGKKVLTVDIVAGARILEVGAYDVNGSLRGTVAALGPSKYVGVDVNVGPSVDDVCSASDLVERFGPESFDVVISTEMLEHALDWKTAIRNMKACLKVGGHLLLTTRSAGFPYHNPPDHWRFSMSDAQHVFRDFDGAVENDPQVPGILFFGRKVSSEQADLDVEAMAVVPS